MMIDIIHCAMFIAVHCDDGTVQWLINIFVLQFIVHWCLWWYLLASQSDAHRIAPHRDPIQPIHPLPNPTYSSKARKTHDVLKRKSYKDLKNNVPK